jgi:hypothetical protein
MKRFLVVLLALVAVGSSFGMVLMYRRYSTSRAVVNFAGGKLTVKDFNDRLELVSGQQVMNKLLLRRMMLSAANKAGVAPTRQDVDRRIEYLRRRDPASIGRALMEPQSTVLLREDIETDLALEALTVVGIELAPAEVQGFYMANKAQFDALQQADTTVAVTGNSVDAAKAENLMKERTPDGKPRFDPGTLSRQNRIEVVGINAKFDFNTVAPETMARIKETVVNLSRNSVRTFQIATAGPHQFVTIRIERASKAGPPGLEEIRKEVEQSAKLAKAGGNDAKMRMLVKVYQDSKPEFEMPKYARYFQQIEDLSKQLESQKPQVSSTN